LINTNENINGNFSSIDSGELYRQNILSLYPSINTDENVPSVYIERITVEKQGIKKKKSKDTITCHL
jgi:hypothetical protein